VGYLRNSPLRLSLPSGRFSIQTRRRKSMVLSISCRRTQLAVTFIFLIRSRIHFGRALKNSHLFSWRSGSELSLLCFTTGAVAFPSKQHLNSLDITLCPRGQTIRTVAIALRLPRAAIVDAAGKNGNAKTRTARAQDHDRGTCCALGRHRTPSLQIRRELRAYPLPGHTSVDLPKWCSVMRNRRQR
jgi:hypothetical protein